MPRDDLRARGDRDLAERLQVGGIVEDAERLLDLFAVGVGGRRPHAAVAEQAATQLRHPPVVVDAGQDGSFKYEDLAGTIRKIRTDLGVAIDFAAATRPMPGQPPTWRYSLGRLAYPESPDRPGYLVYIKPVMLPGAPLDVTHFEVVRKEAGATFPHESTADQFFDEAQFESYRMLGVVSGEAVRDALGSLEERAVERRWLRDGREPVAAAPAAASFAARAGCVSPAASL